MIRVTGRVRVTIRVRVMARRSPIRFFPLPFPGLGFFIFPLVGFPVESSRCCFVPASSPSFCSYFILSSHKYGAFDALPGRARWTWRYGRTRQRRPDDGHVREGVHLVFSAPEDAQARPSGRAHGGDGTHARPIRRRVHVTLTLIIVKIKSS